MSRYNIDFLKLPNVTVITIIIIIIDTRNMNVDMCIANIINGVNNSIN